MKSFAIFLAVFFGVSPAVIAGSESLSESGVCTAEVSGQKKCRAKVIKYEDEASQTPEEIAVVTMRGIASALELYYCRYKSYPLDLQTLVKDGYMAESMLTDPWKHAFRYKPLADPNGCSISNYLLGSNGPDGKPDTADDIAPAINPVRHSFPGSNSK